VPAVLAQHRRPAGQRRQFRVVDLNQLDRVGRDVAVVGHHEDDLLILE
jgi:hypothetical protein